MATKYEYDLANKKRDLSDVMSTVMERTGRLIQQVKVVKDATNKKYEWLENQIAGRSITLTADATGSSPSITIQMSAADYADIKVGTILRAKDSIITYKVTAKTSASDVTIKVNSLFGETYAGLSEDDVLDIISTPIKEASSNGDGESGLHASSTNYNYIQTIRKEIDISDDAINTGIYGSLDNGIAEQGVIKLKEIIDELSRMLIYGLRDEPDSGNDGAGEAGGIYDFATQTGGLEVDVDNISGATSLTSTIVNDGAELIRAEGGNASVVVCSIKQARKLSAENQDKLRVMVDDKKLGQYSAVITNDIDGSQMTIYADYNLPDSEAWVIDPSALGISYLQNNRLRDFDSTTPGYDGIKRTMIVKFTFEIKNALQKLCRIKNLSLS